MNVFRYLTLIAFFLVTDFAFSQSRCDCREIVAGCTGTVEAEGKWITITSSSQSCSRIDYYINGHPRLNVVMDGRDQEEWLGPSKIESIDVQGCVVCKDRLLGSGSGGELGSGEPGSSRVDPLDQQLLGLWSKIPRTFEHPGQTNHRSGTMRVIQKLGSGKYSISSTTEWHEVLKHGRYWASGPCWGSTADCFRTEHANGTLTVNGSRVTIRYDKPDWSPDRLTLNGRTLQGSDSSGGPVGLVKR